MTSTKGTITPPSIPGKGEGSDWAPSREEAVVTKNSKDLTGFIKNFFAQGKLLVKNALFLTIVASNCLATAGTVLLLKL